jgi:hypothetical protein
VHTFFNAFYTWKSDCRTNREEAQGFRIWEQFYLSSGMIKDGGVAGDAAVTEAGCLKGLGRGDLGALHHHPLLLRIEGADLFSP